MALDPKLAQCEVTERGYARAFGRSRPWLYAQIRSGKLPPLPVTVARLEQLRGSPFNAEQLRKVLPGSERNVFTRSQLREAQRVAWRNGADAVLKRLPLETRQQLLAEMIAAHDVHKTLIEVEAEEVAHG